MSKKKRLKKIKNLLLEMGAGKFFYRIERSTKSDTVEALISVLNMMGEEIEEALVHQGYLNANEIIKHVIVMQFAINREGKIVAINEGVKTILNYSSETLFGETLAQIFEPKSRIKWEEIWALIEEEQLRAVALQLSFRTKDGLLVPSACYLNKLEWEQKEAGIMMLTVVKHSKKQVELETNVKEQILKIPDRKGLAGEMAKEGVRKKVRLTQEDIRMIEDARSLMLSDLAKDFRPLKDFALQLGTNTFKLKYGFKELYGISVYRFLRNERLRKAKVLVQYGDEPFKIIAQLCGFVSVPHFSRIFKEEFGLTPTELRDKTFLREE